MNSNLDFKELWAQQTLDAPKIEKVLSSFYRLRRKGLIKLILVNLLMVTTIAVILFIWVYFEPELITTKIGLVVTLGTISFFVWAYNQIIPNLTRLDETQNSKQFLTAALKLKNRQRYLQTKVLKIYFIGLSLGICLYLYEYVQLMTFKWAILIYVLAALWIGFNWFYLRPKISKRESDKIDLIIKKLEAIQNDSRQ